MEIAEGLVSRKRACVNNVGSQSEASHRNVKGAGGSGVNRTLTIVGNRGIMMPTVDEHQRKEIVRVEVRPNERWVGNATVPLHGFQVFNLPQDSVAYADRSRGKLAERCLNRAGRVRILFSFPCLLLFLPITHCPFPIIVFAVSTRFGACVGGF